VVTRASGRPRGKDFRAPGGRRESTNASSKFNATQFGAKIGRRRLIADFVEEERQPIADFAVRRLLDGVLQQRLEAKCLGTQLLRAPSRRSKLSSSSALIRSRTRCRAAFGTGLTLSVTRATACSG